MATIFTRIINGELPGRFVWRDSQCVAFLSIQPLAQGHTLVVPIAEVDHWLDLPPALHAHLTAVSQHIGKAIQSAFAPKKVGMCVIGLEVPHVHIHLSPINGIGDMNFANADPKPSAEKMDDSMNRIRAALREQGHTASVPQ
ncbi:MAG: HIT family protein [Planctomycetota bacterium]